MKVDVCTVGVFLFVCEVVWWRWVDGVPAWASFSSGMAYLGLMCIRAVRFEFSNHPVIHVAGGRCLPEQRQGP